MIMVAADPTRISARQIPMSARIGDSRATRYTPAFTIVAACRYVLIGVGATIAREPAAERDLRRLRERADEDEDQADADRRPDRGRRRELAQPVRARRLADQDEPGEQRQAARAGDQDRRQRRVAGSGVLVVVADEEVRRDRRQLPEDEQREQVVGEDHAEHRAGEQR
jgi:hypothetical protein